MVTTGLTIEKLVYGGDGLSRVEGQVVLTPFVLSGETVDVEPETVKSGVQRARLLTVVQPSPDRVEPPCPYFGRCGGCQYQHATYPAQLQVKRDILAETLQRVGKIEWTGEIGIVSAEPWAYRNRTQLHIEGGKLGYLERNSHKLCAIDHCPISSPKINQCIQALLGMIRQRRWPKFIRSIELFTNETEVQLNVLDTSQPVAKHFFEWCAAEMPGLVTGALEYNGFRVSHNSFFQVNRFLVDKIVETALADASGESALDLYAGVGLFALPMSRRFGKVTAVESGSGAVQDLKFNAERAGAQVNAVVASVDAHLRAFEGPVDFVLADPPRAGLGKPVVSRLIEMKPARISIVSCDPATLARDLAGLLAGGYRLERITMIDLFPQTFHIESVVHLSRVDAASDPLN